MWLCCCCQADQGRRQTHLCSPWLREKGSANQRQDLAHWCVWIQQIFGGGKCSLISIFYFITINSVMLIQCYWLKTLSFPVIVPNYCQDNEISISKRPVPAIQITSAFMCIPTRNYSPFPASKIPRHTQLEPAFPWFSALLLPVLGYCCWRQALKDICNSWCTRLSSEGHGILRWQHINYLCLLIMSNKSSLHQGCSCSGDNHTQWWLSTEIKLLLQKGLFPARAEATDNSNATRKVRATKGMMARRSDSEATKLAVAFDTALWQFPAPNLDSSTAHLMSFSHSQLVLGWGCCVNLSFGWPLTMPSPQCAFLSKKLRAASPFAGCQVPWVSQHPPGQSPSLGWLEGLQIFILFQLSHSKPRANRFLLWFLMY